MLNGAAIQIRILDPKIQAYLQKYPFAEGPDAAMNVAAREAILTGLTFRPTAPDYAPRLLSSSESKLPQHDQGRLDELFSKLKIGLRQAANYKDDFEWEANLLPRTKNNVLVIGCGDGVELIFMRAVLPEARITAIDYKESLLPGLKENIGVRFLQGDMNIQLKTLAREYDLITSNHTLEHLYTPDEVLALLVSLLVPGGHLISILPMTSKEGTPFLEKVRAAVASRRSHPLEMIFLDGGHPWKTNPGDLKQTMERAGLSRVEIYQRPNHLSRFLNISPAHYAKSRRLQIRCNTIFLSPIRGLLKALFTKTVPSKLPKALFAIERRTFCGSNIVLNRYSEEAFVIGESSK